MGAGPSSATVPSEYDLVISVNGGNSTGFVFDDAVEPSLPFRTHRAIYTYTPTFIERTNVSGDYGDNQQDFFLTATQRDWSLGELQRYFRASGDSASRYWTGTIVDVGSVPGQVAIGPVVNALSSLLSVTPVCIASSPMGISGGARIGLASSTNLYTVDDGFTVVDRSTHGAGATPALRGMCSDGANFYLSSNKTDNASSVGIRKWNGTTYSNFATGVGCDSLAFLNNTLYGLDWHDGNLYRFDTAGTATSVQQWKDAAGNAMRVGGSSASASSFILPYGGKLAIVLIPNNASANSSCSLWMYDGTAASLAQQLPSGFVPSDACVSLGTLFIAGIVRSSYGAVYSYSGGNLSLLYQQAPGTTGGGPGIAPWESGILISGVQGSNSNLGYYNAKTGGISAVGSISSGQSLLGSSGQVVVGIVPGVTGSARGWSAASTTNSTGIVYTSQFDFDNALPKIFRSVIVEYEAGSDGNGGSVDVAYQINGVGGTYTSLASGVTSGAETLFNNGTAGRSIGLKITLNKGTSTSGPVLKKIMVRAAPVLTHFKTREYILNCTGSPGTENTLLLRSGDAHPLSGREQVDALVTAAEAVGIGTVGSGYLTISDRLGSYTGVIETLEIFEEHPSQRRDSSKSGSFVVHLACREI